MAKKTQTPETGSLGRRIEERRAEALVRWRELARTAAAGGNVSADDVLQEAATLGIDEPAEAFDDDVATLKELASWEQQLKQAEAAIDTVSDRHGEITAEIERCLERARALQDELGGLRGAMLAAPFIEGDMARTRAQSPRLHPVDAAVRGGLVQYANQLTPAVEIAMARSMDAARLMLHEQEVEARKATVGASWS